jgi:hypothetical protein
MYYLGLGDRSVYNMDRFGYGLIHMLKAWDVHFDTQYNASMIVCGGFIKHFGWGDPDRS